MSRRAAPGFDYAYRFPGMNKVLQAAGRVIRTPEDRGVVLLIDDRFLAPDTRRPDAAALGAAENRGLGASADSGTGRILEITPVRRLNLPPLQKYAFAIRCCFAEKAKFVWSALLHLYLCVL